MGLLGTEDSLSPSLSYRGQVVANALGKCQFVADSTNSQPQHCAFFFFFFSVNSWVHLCFSFTIVGLSSLLEGAVANQGRKGLLLQWRSSQEMTVLPWEQDPGSPSRDTYNNIFEFFCRTETSNKWKTLTTWWDTHHSKEGYSFPITTWPQMISGLKEYTLLTPWSLCGTLPLGNEARS